MVEFQRLLLHFNFLSQINVAKESIQAVQVTITKATRDEEIETSMEQLQLCDQGSTFDMNGSVAELLLRKNDKLCEILFRHHLFDIVCSITIMHLYRHFILNGHCVFN